MAREEGFRLVPEREQRLLRAQSRARLGEGHDLLRLHRVGAGLAGIAAKGAVAAVVAAEGRQRYEDLGREGDGAAASAVDPEIEAEVEVASVVADAAWLWDDPDCLPVARRQLLHVRLAGGGDLVMARAEGRKPPAQGQGVTFHVQTDDIFAFHPVTGARLAG